MEELYAEAGCKPKMTGKYLAMKAGAVALGVVFLFCALFVPNMIIRLVAAIGIVGVIYVFPMLSIEYEYIFCDGQIDFDKILGGSKRKTALKIDFEDVEVVAPVSADAVLAHKNTAVKDFTSKDPSRRVYAIIGKVGDQNMKILFEPTERMVEAMRSKSPRKVQR